MSWGPCAKLRRKRRADLYVASRPVVRFQLEPKSAYHKPGSRRFWGGSSKDNGSARSRTLSAAASEEDTRGPPALNPGGSMLVGPDLLGDALSLSSDESPFRAMGNECFCL